MATTLFTKKTLGLETVEPAVTPPPANANTTFVKETQTRSGNPKSARFPRSVDQMPKCGTMVFDKELDENLKVCPHCQHHFPIGARERIHSLVETCTFEEMDADMTSVDILEFYRRRFLQVQAREIPESHRPQGRRHHRHWQNRRTSRRARGHGF